MKKLFTPYETGSLKLRGQPVIGTYRYYLTANPEIPEKTYKAIRSAFKNAGAVNNGFAADITQHMIASVPDTHSGEGKAMPGFKQYIFRTTLK